jgi:lipoprotein Spr
VKNFFYLFILLGLLTSCTATRKSYPGSNSAPPPKQLPRDPKFLENISIKPEEDNRVSVGNNAPITETIRYVPGMVFSTNIEKCNALQFKYSILMGEPVESVTNERLITFLESWYGIPYKFGGNDRAGIDCSAFTTILMDSVYGIALPRTAASQFEMGIRIRKEQLEQGDLVFFNTTGGISHVGVFLANNKFVHAGVSNGVMISDLEDGYYKKRFAGASRVK